MAARNQTYPVVRRAKTDRQKALLAKVQRLCLLLAAHPNLKPYHRLLQNQALRLAGEADSLVLQDVERVLGAVKLSPLLGALAAGDPEKRPLDPWGVIETEDRTLKENFDQEMFLAAQRFYALPPNYTRFLRKRTYTDRDSGREVTFMGVCTPRKAALEGSACWVQVNPVRGGEGLNKKGLPRKASNSEIAFLNNITLDFEFPPDPERIHVIGVELAAFLIEIGLAQPGLPVEDSGAGAHIVIPIMPYEIASGEGEKVNECVRKIVAAYITPQFDRLLKRYGLEGLAKLEGYDISRILSMPGTFRPGGNKPGEAAYIQAGYLRRWLPPYEGGNFPERTESATWNALIYNLSNHASAETLQEIIQTKPGAQAALDEPDTPLPAGSAGPGPGQIKKLKRGQTELDWLEEYAAKNPPTTMASDGKGFARHAYFHVLVHATRLRLGADASLRLATDIDRISGGKFGRHAYQQVINSLHHA
jgi:hypothetical protein